MNWCQMAVFLYCAALTHFVADFLSHRKKIGKFIFLHCFLYTIFFVPLFWWLKVNLWWLFLIFFSHLTIDSFGNKLLPLVKIILKESEEKETFLKIIALGIDQVFHLTILLIAAIFIFW